MLRATSSIKRFLTSTLLSKWALVPAGAVALSLPTLAHADSYRDRFRDKGEHVGRDRDVAWRHRDGNWRDHDRRDGGTRVDVDIHIGRGRPAPRPEYRDRVVKVWVPPVYKTVVDRKWVEPVYRVECETVWVEPVYEERVVEFIGGHGRLRTRVERVLVRDGYWDKRERRVCVSEGRWETCERQVLVSPGRYETRVEHVRVDHRGHDRDRLDPLVVVNPGLGGIWRR